MKDIINSFPSKLPLSSQGQDPKRKWFGWTQSPASLTQALLQSVEELFNAVAGDTPDIKKANVLNAVGQIYDSYIARALPLSLSPVNPLIRYLVVGLVVPQILDWLISKEEAVGMRILKVEPGEFLHLPQGIEFKTYGDECQVSGQSTTHYLGETVNL